MSRSGFAKHSLAYKLRTERGARVGSDMPRSSELRQSKVTDRGHHGAEVANGLGVTSQTLYQWIRRYRVPEPERLDTDAQNAELRRLRAEFMRVTEERDILKMDSTYSAKTSE